MDKNRLFNLIENTGVSYELKESVKSAINNKNYVQVDSERINSMILLEKPSDGKKINTLKQIISHSLSVILDYETQVLDTLKDSFLLALQDYPIDMIEHVLNVLDSYYSDERKDKTIRKGIDTKAISRIRNLCAVFGSYDIYDILSNRIEFIDYHLVNKWGDSKPQESRLDGSKVKNYFVIKDKTTGNIIIVGESIQLLFKDFNVILPNQAKLLKEDRLQLLHKNKIRLLNSKFKKLTINPEYEKVANDAKSSLESNLMTPDLIISNKLLQMLDKITSKIDSGDYGEFIKSFNPKRNYINWLLDAGKSKKLPNYIQSLITKLGSINQDLSSQEMLILFSYYARESKIDLESITNIVNNIKYFLNKGEILSDQIQALLSQKSINQIQLLQILDNAGHLLIQAKLKNKQTLQDFEISHKIKVKQIAKEFFPLVLQGRKEYSKDILFFNLIISNSSQKTSLSIIKELLKAWTIGINGIQDFDFGAKLNDNICSMESVDRLPGNLSLLLLEYNKFKCFHNTIKPSENMLKEIIDKTIDLDKNQLTWAQLNLQIRKITKNNLKLKNYPKSFILIENLKDDNGDQINYFEFVQKVNQTYFLDNSNIGSYINGAFLSISNYTKFGLIPSEKVESIISIYKLYNKQGFENINQSDAEIYEDFNFFMNLKGFVSIMYYPNSILSKKYILPSVSEKIKQFVYICKEYFQYSSNEQINNLYNDFLHLSKINQSKNIVFYGSGSNPNPQISNNSIKFNTYFLLTENVFSLDYKNINGVRFVNLESMKNRLKQIQNDYISFKQLLNNFPNFIDDLSLILGNNFIHNIDISYDSKSLSNFKDLILRPHNNEVLVPINLINVIQSIIELCKNNGIIKKNI